MLVGMKECVDLDMRCLKRINLRYIPNTACTDSTMIMITMMEEMYIFHALEKCYMEQGRWSIPGGTAAPNELKLRLKIKKGC